MKRYTAEQVRERLRRECERVTQKAWADVHGISPAYVSDVLKGQREPGEKVLAALGFQRVVAYERRAP